MKRLLIVFIVCITGAALVGCTGQVSTTTPTPSVTATITPSITPDRPGTATQQAIHLEETSVAQAATADAAMTSAAETIVAEAETAIAEAEATAQAAEAALATVQAEEQANAAATATEAARPTATFTPSPTPLPTDTPEPTFTSTPTEAPFTIHSLESLGLELLIPRDLEGPTPADEKTVIFGNVEGEEAYGIVITNLPPEELPAPTDSDTTPDDPVEILAAALADIDTSATGLEVLQEPVPYDGLDMPAARMRLQLASPEAVMETILFQQGRDNWWMFAFYGQPDELEAMITPVMGSLMFMAPVVSTLPPAVIYTTPTPTPVPEIGAELGLGFTVPEGWEVRQSTTPDIERPVLELFLPGDEAERSIGLLRGGAGELVNLGFPAGETDPVAALTGIAEREMALNEDFSGGRYNEVQIGNFSGAWTTIRADFITQRYYLFKLGGDQWLLIGAQAVPDAFGPFSRAEVRDFLASMELLPDDGVALGLNFVVADGWTLTDWSGEPAIEAAGVALLPPAPDEASRGIYLVRGTTADFPEITLPEESQSPASFLDANRDLITEMFDSTNMGRVNEFMLGTWSGAWVGLRGDEATGRIYLFEPQPDDWILIYAEAARSAFNDFNRAELREFLASLALADSQAAQLTVEPIGPVEEAVVTHVSDGDTIYVMLDGVEESVRIIGIDTPEAHHPDYGVNWLGYEATHYMHQFVQAGSTVYLESDIRDRDDYDRLLRYVWIKDDNDNWVLVEGELVRAGMAHVKTYDEDRYVSYFLALEREAQQEELGLWGDPPPPPPTESMAAVNDTVWAVNPDGEAVPLLYDAAALGIVPDPIATWPNGIQATVRDTYYVYPEDIDPATGEQVAAEKSGYWYWLEINDFRGWVPESWILTEAPDNAVLPPDTDIIAYAQPFIVSEEPLAALSAPGTGEVTGEFPPESRVQVERLGIDPEGAWWLYADTQGVDGWLPLANLNRLSPENR